MATATLTLPLTVNQPINDLPTPLLPSGQRIILKTYNGLWVPVNDAGETYPSHYVTGSGPTNAGSGVVSIHDGTGIASNRCLSVTINNGYLEAQHNPYYASGNRGFAREEREPNQTWLFDTYNRFRFWIKPGGMNPTGNYYEHNFEWGTYVKRVANANQNSDEDGGGHFYHFANVPGIGELGESVWVQVIFNMHPNHEREASGTIEHGNMPHPTGESAYNYMDCLTRFYFDIWYPSIYPEEHLFDFYEFYEETRAEADDRVYGIAATYVPSTNLTFLSWNVHKNIVVNYELRYSFSDIHMTGWANAIPAPNGIFVHPNDNGYNAMVYKDTTINWQANDYLYLAIKPADQTVFTQVVIPRSI